MRPLAFALALTLFGCTSPRGSGAPPATVVGASPAAVIVAPDVVLTTPDAAAPVDVAPEDLAPEPPNPRVTLLRGLAAGTVAIPDAIVATRGVTVIRFIEAPPSGRGSEQISSRHLCGAALTRAIPALRRDLAEAVAQGDAQDALECENDECIVPGMEYQPSWRLYFVSLNGAPRLEAIAQVSEAALGEPWLTRMHDHVSTNLAAARARPCPTRR